MVTHRRQVDDAGGPAGTETRQQQVGQVEVAEVVDAERVLEALRRLLAGRPGPSSVVDEDVEVVPPGQDLVRCGSDRFQVGEIERHDMDVVVPRPLGDLVGRRLRLGSISAGQHRRCPLRRHPDGRLEPDTHVRPGDDHDLALHAHIDPIRSDPHRARPSLVRRREASHVQRSPNGPDVSLFFFFLPYPPCVCSHSEGGPRADASGPRRSALTPVNDPPALGRRQRPRPLQRPRQLRPVAQCVELLQADVPAGSITRRLAVVGGRQAQAQDAPRPIRLQFEAQDVIGPAQLHERRGDESSVSPSKGAASDWRNEKMQRGTGDTLALQGGREPRRQVPVLGESPPHPFLWMGQPALETQDRDVAAFERADSSDPDPVPGVAHVQVSPSLPSMISRWRSRALRWPAHCRRYGASHSSTARSGSGLTR